MAWRRLLLGALLAIALLAACEYQPTLAQRPEPELAGCHERAYHVGTHSHFTCELGQRGILAVCAWFGRAMGWAAFDGGFLGAFASIVWLAVYVSGVCVSMEGRQS